MTGANDKGTATYPCTVPGLFAVRPTQSVQTLKEAPWPQMLALLGASGEKIMTHLLLDCALFLPVDAGHGNYIQLTGASALFAWVTQPRPCIPHGRSRKLTCQENRCLT